MTVSLPNRDRLVLLASISERLFTRRHQVPITYRLVDSRGELLTSGDTIEYLKGFLRDLGPGRYSVDEIGAEPGASGHTSRRWGVLFKLQDGTILTEPDPWEE
jgi:hypothetical protein